MNWRDFKQAVEAQGVKDTTEIDWIDFHSAEGRRLVVAVSYGNKVKIQDDEYFAKHDLPVFARKQAD